MKQGDKIEINGGEFEIREIDVLDPGSSGIGIIKDAVSHPDRKPSERYAAISVDTKEFVSDWFDNFEEAADAAFDIIEETAGGNAHPMEHHIDGALQDIEGVLANLNRSLDTATPVESLLILKHVETAARLRSEIEQLVSAISKGD